jgi:hypothetical protein
MTDPHRIAAEAIYNAMLNAQRDAGDAALCEALDLLAADTGQNKFRHAAAVLRGRNGGRPKIDDTFALRRIGNGSSVSAIASKLTGSATKPESIERRLRRKRGKKKLG